MKIYLKYIGKGAFIANVPARDLTREEAESHGLNNLLESGLYERAEKEEPKKKETKGDE